MSFFKHEKIRLNPVSHSVTDCDRLWLQDHTFNIFQVIREINNIIKCFNKYGFDYTILHIFLLNEKIKRY